MHGTFTTRPEDATPDWSWVDLEVVVVPGRDPDMVMQYRVTCNNRETGRLVGSTVVPAGPGGRPPTVTVADVVALLGGYRFASVYVEVEAAQLDRRSRRVADSVRRWHLAQRRRALRRAFEENDGYVGRGSPS